MSTKGMSPVQESLTEMITHVANEPSWGLFFVQQHAHYSVPRLASIKSKLLDTSQEVFLCTEDMNDALSTVKSLNECGPSIIDRMIKNLDSSVSIMSSLHQHKRNGERLDQPIFSRESNAIRAVWDSAFQKAGSSHWRSSALDLCQGGGHKKESSSTTHERSGDPIAGSSGMNPAASSRYLLPLKSVLQRAGNLGWRRPTLDNRHDMNIGMLQRSYSAQDLKVIVGSRSSDCEYAMNDPAIFTSEAVGEGSRVFSRADEDNSKEMDQDDQLPVSRQPLFQSEDISKTKIPKAAQARRVPKSDIKVLKLREKN